MSFTAEQKSQLAKLMATENLTIQHQKMQTAKFDPKNRILYLPVWQNMSGFMYDLLCGHEVGHALYTPADGWHDVATDKSKGRSYKSFLNVVEDARIEKKVKRRYPGLRMSFQKGYQDLMEKDFFGLKGRDINKMSFIDRLNLFTKSQYTANWIEFSAQEEVFIRKVENLETWEDVLRITDEIYEYSKNEQHELQMNDFESYEEDPDGQEMEFEDDDGDDFGDEEESDEELEEGNTTKNSDEDGEEDEGETKEGTNRDKESSESTEDQFEPSCETDENYRRNETMLLDEKCKPYVYANIPKPILKNIVTPAKRVHELLTEDFKKQMTVNVYGDQPRFGESDVTLWVNEFKSKNERYIGLLAKEFEMRKAAKAFSKSKLSDTGDIDINKLATFKFDDNIFRKVMLTPKGKNHGLVLLLDKSGSMTNNMAGSIEQILVLTMFCRKVNIPFIVYGFGDCTTTRLYDTKQNHNDLQKCFEDTLGNLSFTSVFLREYLNSKMSNVEFTKAVRNLILVKRSYEGRSSPVFRPKSESLSNTPLTQALVATAEIMNKFRKDNNLDLTSLVIVHDGDADWINSVIEEREVRDYEGNLVTKKYPTALDPYGNNNVITDNANKLTFKYGRYDRSGMNEIILNWFRKVTNSKVFGFYLTANSYQGKGAISRYYYDEDVKQLDEHRHKNFYGYEELKKKLYKQFKTQKFVHSYNPGYDSFFIVSGGDDLVTENEEIEIDGEVTASKLKTAFMKFNKKKAINRVLVSRFITGIAA
jgi:cobalamin biosynthesis protein CobT